MASMLDTASTPPARKYNVDELLSLREELTPAKNELLLRSLRERSGDSCLLLRGKKDGPAEECKVKPSLADMTNRKLLRLNRQRLGSSCSEDIARVSLKRETAFPQWSLRQRDTSDLSAQPYSAPSDITSQQSENFRRFYRAVVSPTHVRVTAGGRIVRNTRSSGPPPEWNGEKHVFEPVRTQISNSNVHQESTSQSSQPRAAFPLPSSAEPNYNQLQRSTALPIATLANNYSSKVVAHSIDKSGDVKEVQKQATHLNFASSNPIKLSPASQFDQSKPFMYNGHIIFPISTALNTPVPTIPSTHNSLVQPSLVPQNTSQFFLQQIPYHYGPISDAGGLQALACTVPALQLQESHSQHSMYHGSGLPTISELTKNHMQAYRNYLKFIDNQLANNKHQIDEMQMGAERVNVVSTIEKMEALLEVQLAHERTASLARYQNDAEVVQPHRALNGNNRREISSSAASAKDSIPMFAKAPTVAVHITAAAEAERPNNFTQGIKLLENSRVEKPITQSEPVTSTSRLSAAAAKAPPFQPRASSFLDPNNSVSIHTSAGRPAAGTDDNFLGAVSSTSWAFPISADVIAGQQHTNSSKARTFYDESPHLLDNMGCTRSQTFNGLPSSLSNLSLTTPYLIGTLPSGLPLHQASPTDFIYHRELTPDEVQARYLYWGKAPKAAYGALPKFDGKDFYPSSPVKRGAAQLKNLDVSTASTIPSSGELSVASIDLETLFTEPASGNTTPVRAMINLRSREANLSQDFADDALIVQKSPLTQSSNYHRRNASDYPATPPSMNKRVLASNSHDFSDLFLHRGDAGYKSPSPARLRLEHLTDPVTPRNKERKTYLEKAEEEDDVKSADSWGAPLVGDSPKSKVVSNSEVYNREGRILASSLSYDNNPEVTPKDSIPTSSLSHEPRDRISSLEHQSLLLQSMLKKSTQAALATPAPALSGMVSSTTAQGYLPIYRGSAIASLTPGYSDSKVTSDGGIPVTTTSFLPGNRPLRHDDLPQGLIRAPTESTGAEGYMRYLSHKAENDQKILESGWNANTSATGPVMGSDW